MMITPTRHAADASGIPNHPKGTCRDNLSEGDDGKRLAAVPLRGRRTPEPAALASLSQESASPDR